MSWGVATQNGVSVSIASIVSLSSGATEFSPIDLFTGGAKGAWYDPSDYSTLFQDSAGTTPVTAVEQPVGLMLDKSQGATLGSELVANGDFSSGTGWTLAGTASISGGKLNLPAVSDGAAYAISGLVAGQYYRVTFDYNNIPSNNGGATAAIETGSTFTSTGTKFSGSGSFTGFVVATSAPAFFKIFLPNAGAPSGTTWIDNVSVKALPGNHASQSTAASRPVLRARYNLLTYSEQFDNAAWTKSSCSITPNQEVAPDGTTTVDLLQFSAQFGRLQQGSLTSGVVYTFSIWCRVASGTRVYSLYDSLGNSIGSFTATTTLTRYSITFTAPATATLYAVQDRNAGPFVDTYVWGADLRTGSSAGTYQRIAAATDYATAGFAPYLAFDGVDDFLGAAYVQSAYPLTIAAGVNNDTTAVGGLGIVSVSQSDAQYKVLRDISTGGTDASDRNASNLTTSTITVSGNKFALAQFETSLMTHQVNGGTAVTTANTNAFGTSVNIFVGKTRPSGLFSPARDYGAVVIDAVLTAAQKDSLKNWMAAKMGVTL